jgi:hypothetical protein
MSGWKMEHQERMRPVNGFGLFPAIKQCPNLMASMLRRGLIDIVRVAKVNDINILGIKPQLIHVRTVHPLCQVQAKPR